ncbi:MAG TPA: hypothetical protein VMF51_23570 [Nocardioides sp.]|uniref:hypothetical protein n=1 Tax=Nocardioides sp. TaxID=35761 RepID=UPI002B6F3C3B|nr:hypothetical protein [Nocardioides sp.]HTW18125.1 hypothetical protein [Nocardioides sp.]
MPDLDDDLFAGFKNEGSPVNPLPASEVRRRGDRMRRRNTALATVGGVAAALVVIATPIAVVADQSSPEQPDPPIATRPAPPEWLQEIPGDLDVAAGLDGTETTDEPAVASIAICGETAFDAGAGTVDVAGAAYEETGTEHSIGRTLALYPDDAAAGAAMNDLRDATEACDSAPFGTVGDTVRWERVEGGLPTDESFALTQGFYGEGEDYPTQADYFVVARTGNALLVTSATGVAPNDQQVGLEQDAVADLVESMQVFSPGTD